MCIEKIKLNLSVNLMSMIKKAIHCASELEYTFKFRFTVKYSNIIEHRSKLSYLSVVDLSNSCSKNAYFSINTIFK